jgi:hypothetical protein
MNNYITLDKKGEAIFPVLSKPKYGELGFVLASAFRLTTVN